MRLISTICRVLILLVAMMVWQTHVARAHGMEDEESYTASSYSGADAHTASVSDKNDNVQIVSSASERSHKNCLGICCSGAACCFAAVLSENTSVPDLAGLHFVPVGPQTVLPQGPPYSLSRPPRFSV